MRRNWLNRLGLALALAGFLAATGCRSTSTTRKGVTSIESASEKRDGMLETVAKAKIDPNPVVPVSYTAPATGGECSH